MLIRRLRDQEGSLPLALLVAIIVAGISAALFARVAAGERTTRFDVTYAEVLPAADAGLNEALFWLNAGQRPAPGVPQVFAAQEIDGVNVEVTVEDHPTLPTSFLATARADRQDGNGTPVVRELQAIISESPLFFPGAFGDTFVGVNGTSTFVDSYDPDCRIGASCGWGTAANFGTGLGTLGTNEVFDFSGNPQFKPGNALLYDMTANPPGGTSAGDPYGDRCNGNPCNDAANITPIGERQAVTTDAVYGWIREKFEPGGVCETSGVGDHYSVNGAAWTESGKKSDGPATIEAFHDAVGAGFTPSASVDVTSPGFTNFYCVDSIEWLRDIDLADSVTVDNPVVVFVRDSMRVDNQRNIACEDWQTPYKPCPTGNAAPASDNPDNDILPKARRLQIYVYGDPSGGSGGGEISIRAQTVFAGILYAPTSVCNGPNGGIDVYGSLFCGSLNNVGNWAFHYDEDLSSVTTGRLSFGRWSETADG